jgi:hypothetical protein
LAAVLLGSFQPLKSQPAQVPAAPDSSGFQWKAALTESGIFLAIQHSSRMLQKKTRRELGGPFFSDYFESVSNIHTWSDGDGIPTNYIGHPILGAVFGNIQIFNDPHGRDLEFDLSSKQYWKSRLKAMAWSAAYSTQFEIGPVSEASIGNVGKHPPTMAVVDLAVTPVGGFTMMLIEDYVDKRFISRWERHMSPFKARMLRTLLNPSRSIANTLRWKRPSFRDGRGL